MGTLEERTSGEALKLYHGTSERKTKKALVEGLLPRGRRKGNWTHTVDSRNDAVYLTDIYGPYFAFCATDTERKDRCAIFEIETDNLNENQMLPDEDYMEQTFRGRGGNAPAGMKARVEYYREITIINRHMWKDSVKYLGTAAYLGRIEPQRITKLAYVDMEHPFIMQGAEAMISLINHKLCWRRYDAITRFFMGETVTPEEVDDFLNTQTEDEVWKKMMGERRGFLEKVLSTRKGIELVSIPQK
jgi:hypothetical protein